MNLTALWPKSRCTAAVGPTRGILGATVAVRFGRGWRNRRRQPIDGRPVCAIEFRHDDRAIVWPQRHCWQSADDFNALVTWAALSRLKSPLDAHAPGR